jgi:hypothetical protein
MSEEISKPIPQFATPMQPEHRVVYAFTSAGKDFYKFDDSMNIPCGRSFKALSYYEELNMRCTREYLQGVMTASNNIYKEIEQILQSREVNIITIFNKIQELKNFTKHTLERLDYITDYEALLKLASVVYFDSSENPYDYDFKYGNEKIRLWKTEKPADFFLSQPIRSLMPQINLSAEDLDTYLKTLETTTRSQIQEILSHLSEADMNKDFYSTLKSQLNPA